MYATHHKTGKEIRILNHTTTTWRDNKTLVWLDASVASSVPWNRFEVGCVGFKNYEALSEKSIYVDLIVCIDDNDVQWIKNGGYKKTKLIFASKKVLDQVGISFFEEYNITNILCFEELHAIYTFLENIWDGSIEDACILTALVLRFGYTFPIKNKSITRNTYGLTVESQLRSPQEIYFISQYYIPTSNKRSKEINYCLQQNINNPYIDHIILLNEKDYSSSIMKSSKIQQVVMNKRLFYDDVIRYINDSIPKDSIVVFANADIYLDSSIRLIWSTKVDEKFFALLRYDDNNDNTDWEIFGPRPDSQDTWIISSNSVKKRKDQWKYDDLHFSFGMSGCDNAITVEMLRMKYLVVNPSLNIITHHVHTSGLRTYVLDEIVDKKIYLYIEPTGLHDMEPILQLPSKNVETKLTFSEFNRPVVCNKAATYCKMIEKDYKYDMDSKNTFIGQAVPIYKFENIFQTNSGLVYDYNKIYVGLSKIATTYWTKSNLSTLTPSIFVKKSYIAPLPETMTSNVENYLLYYFPKILLMREKFGTDGEFWAPNKKEFVEALSLFNWKSRSIPVISDKNEIAYVKDAYVWFPSDIVDVSKEEMNILRKFMKNLSDDSTSSYVAVYMDNEYINKAFIHDLEEKHSDVKIIFPQTTIDRKLSILQNASILYTVSSKSTSYIWKYIWVMKPLSSVIDIQNEMEMNGEIHHIASACDLKHELHIVPKGPLSEINRKRIINNVSSIDNIPTIFVPNTTVPFFSHAGDSFREMIDIWSEKGYVKKQYSDCKNVWLHNVGDTLLYDRPNYDWIKNAGADEQFWKKGLFGNPAPLGKNSCTWSFWARRPRLVEAMIRIDHIKTKGVVFYGKIENLIQKNNRTQYDWSKVCDKNEFYLAKMNEHAKFSEQEYLDNLSKAKYGLCLAGYGRKCHREVECMAFGTVPVCSVEVDMDNYANPPEENIHYLRVQNPEDAITKIAGISDDAWKQMSDSCKKWYRENCSVDGIWELTKKLSYS